MPANRLAARHAKRPRAELAHGILPELLGYRLRLAQQAVFRDFAASVGGLSPGRAGMVLLIEANPGVTQGRLAETVVSLRDGTSSGGGGGGVPMKFSRIHLPRITGEVRVA